MSFSVKRVCVAPGIVGYWVNDQAAVQGGASPDGFFFSGAPVTPGFRRVREPSAAFCISLELDDGQVALGDCVTVFNAGAAGRPRPLDADDIGAVARALQERFEGRSFAGFRAAAPADRRYPSAAATAQPLRRSAA